MSFLAPQDSTKTIYLPANHNNNNESLLAYYKLRSGGGIMRRRGFVAVLSLISVCVFLSVFCSLRHSRDAISFSVSLAVFDPRFSVQTNPNSSDHVKDIREDVEVMTNRSEPEPEPVPVPVESFSVLLPNWEVLVLVSPATHIPFPLTSQISCNFPRNETSPAKFSGILAFTNLTMFKCMLPKRNRKTQPFYQPVLMNSPDNNSVDISTAMEMPLWNFFVYESISTDSDVIVFTKGINYRQGVNRSPEEFSCVFSDGNGEFIRTPVTSSMQEAFRCPHPNLKSAAERIKVTLEINEENQILQSAAYYSPKSTLRPGPREKLQFCAATMVYNVSKYLREWVMYYSAIGVEKFFLYDNDSDDDLVRVIQELNEEDYNIERIFWIWPKTQEGGFSHSAIYGKDSCKWMVYVDVDEFIYSPLWIPNISSLPQPSKPLLESLLPETDNVGQVSIKSYEFGPSDQEEHPTEGVIQGYDCRRRSDKRHKSILLLDAVDDSLLNVVHHFRLNNSRYRTKQLPLEVAVVNHYKYQAWPEFINKFRRRVSAFVVDWKTDENPTSQDRTPGLGSKPVKPEEWEHMFCEEKDERLKELTQTWFGSQTSDGLKMAWHR